MIVRLVMMAWMERVHLVLVLVLGAGFRARLDVACVLDLVELDD